MITKGTPLPEFDFHLPLLSAPRVLGITEDTIPAEVPYLWAGPARIATWRQRLPSRMVFASASRSLIKVTPKTSRTCVTLAGR